MRIAILATGSRGDVEPYVALGQGLVKAGHSVRLVTHDNYEAYVLSHGLEFWPMGGNVQDIATGEEMRRNLASGRLLRVMAQMAREAEQGALLLARGGLAACRGADLLLGGFGSVFIGLALAEKLDLPLLQAYYIPFTPTGAFPSFLAPGLPEWMGATAMRLSHHLARQVLWQSVRPGDGRARNQVLGLPQAPFFGPYRSPRLRQNPVLYGFSPAVIPPPTDWENTVVTGYWFIDPPSEWAPPPALEAFLQDGPPPVYVGFGSMSSRRPEETTRLVVEAMEQAGQRGVLLSGWGGMQEAALPASMIMVDNVPFAWLFPRCAAVVHHGGAGTTGAGLRAGVPSVITPFFGDQPFWGRRVAALGVGPQPLPQRTLTADRLARAIRQAVTDEEMRRRAAALGAKIAAEDGVRLAAQIIADF